MNESAQTNHSPHYHPFGGDRFGRRAERFARLFGTPGFLVTQTAVVAAWVAVNVFAVALRWDPYPFILLNLAFSLQSAYAAPLILLAQTRQADRDKHQAEVDNRHREDLAVDLARRQTTTLDTAKRLEDLLENNHLLITELQELTRDIHHRVLARE